MLGNEFFFFIHVLAVLGSALIALKIGKEALIAWIGLQAVLANLFVIKQMFFFGLNITCSDIFAIGSILGLNLLREFYGEQSAKRAIRVCLFCMIFFVLMSSFHLLYDPSLFDTSQFAYEVILTASPRLLIASMTVYFIVQQVDLHVFSFLKEKCAGRPLFIRNGLSLTLSQLLDTVLFSFLGLWGLVASVFDIILFSFLVKFLIIILLSPAMSLSKRFFATPKENL